MTIKTANLVTDTKLSTRKVTDAGYLQGYAFFSKAGIQQYVEDEIFGNGSRKVVNVYRPLSVLKDKEFQDSLRLLPITYGHKMVDTTNYHSRVAGNVGENFDIKDDKIGGNVQIFDYENSDDEHEVSLGYKATINDEAGEYQGIPYQYIIDSMIANHMALIDSGRCGSEVRFLDSKKEVNTMLKTDDTKAKDAKEVKDEKKTTELKKDFEFSDTSIKLLVKNKEFMDKLSKLVAADATADDKAKVPNKEEKIVTDEANEKLQKKMITDEVDARVNERVALLSDAKDVFNFSNDELSGMSNRDILIKCLDDEAMKDVSDEMLLGAFSQAKKFKKAIGDSKDIKMNDALYSPASGNGCDIHSVVQMSKLSKRG